MRISVRRFESRRDSVEFFGARWEETLRKRIKCASAAVEMFLFFLAQESWSLAYWCRST